MSLSNDFKKDLMRFVRVCRQHVYLFGVTVASLAALMLTGCGNMNQPPKQEVIYTLQAIDAGSLVDSCIPQTKLSAAQNTNDKAFTQWFQENTLTRRECETNHEELVRILREKGVLTPARPASATP